MTNNAISSRGVFSDAPLQQNDPARLKRRLQKVDFAITEIVLYLDAYPHAKEALAYYHKLTEERTVLMELLAKSGHPITHFDNASSDEWHWAKGPWPWQNEAN